MRALLCKCLCRCRSKHICIHMCICFDRTRLSKNNNNILKPTFPPRPRNAMLSGCWFSSGRHRKKSVSFNIVLWGCGGRDQFIIHPLSQLKKFYIFLDRGVSYKHKAEHNSPSCKHDAKTCKQVSFQTMIHLDVKRRLREGNEFKFIQDHDKCLPVDRPLFRSSSQHPRSSNHGTSSQQAGFQCQ